MYLYCLLLTLAPILDNVHSANILAMVPLPYRSHILSFQPIFRALAARGHNVTVVSPFPQTTPVPNLTDIVVPNVIGEIISVFPINLFDMDTLYFKMTGLWNLGIRGMEVAYKLNEIQRFINDTSSKFDLVIVETWFVQEGFLAFGHKFNAPVINLSPCGLFSIVSLFTGNNLPVTYVPNLLLDHTDRMSFSERVFNTFFYYWEHFYGEQYYMHQQEKLMRKHFIYPGSESIPPLKEMLKNTSLTLINYHLATGYQMPLHKNIVPYAGTNIKRPETLPDDLQKLMDNAKDGVIYFSFGTIFSAKNFEPFMIEAIMSALAKVKQTVLLKIDDPSQLKSYNAGNVEIRQWYPQPSVLAHPNCKLFITHCGFNGMIEATYHAVPMVAVPIFGDQKFNSRFVEKEGIGKIVKIRTISEKVLLDAINEVLSKKSYQENINERSAIFRDNPLDIMDNVIYWIEYVIRHKGAPHLRPAVLDLNWYQRLMLDVIAFYALVIFLIAYTVVKIIKLLFTLITRMCCGKVSKSKCD